MTDHRGELFAALQRLLPQHTLSRLLARIAESRQPWLKDWLIHQAIRQFDIDMSEAIDPDPSTYFSFNDFFTRQLREGSRPIATAADAIVSPADGCISQIGDITDGEIFQAKGNRFSTDSLLADSGSNTRIFDEGIFTTIYLAPRDYHRVHIPYGAELRETRYIPGRLFSVNDTTTRHIPGLFARNERLSCIFDTDCGRMAVVLVGAIFVAGIGTSWQNYYHPGRRLHQEFPNAQVKLDKGDELGLFRFGSTVILLFEKGNRWQDEFAAGSTVRMGQQLGTAFRR